MNDTQTLVAVQVPVLALVGYVIRQIADVRVTLARIETRLADHIGDERAHTPIGGPHA